MLFVYIKYSYIKTYIHLIYKSHIIVYLFNEDKKQFSLHLM